MKKNYKIGKARRGRRESLKETIELDTNQGLLGVLHQISLVACVPFNSVSREKILAYINSGVNYLQKIKQGENENLDKKNSNCDKGSLSNITTDLPLESWENIYVKEKYFCLFRCILLHRCKEVRVAGLRLYRYLIDTEEDVKAVLNCNTTPLIVRCIDICLDNQSERIHAIRLTRHILQVTPSLFPIGLARCIMAISRDGAKERDRLLRSAQAILCELAILNPKIFIESGGVSCHLYSILDCPLIRVNEALLSGLLFLLNDPKWRSLCSQFHMIVAPLSDSHYKHSENDSEYYNKQEEREICLKSGCFAVLAAIRSWPGFITLYQPKESALKSIVDLLLSSQQNTRVVILDFLYDLFRIPICESYTSYESAVKEHCNLLSSDPDSWRLHEGFVVAEAKDLLPHITKFRPNLIQNYFSLVLYTFMKLNLFSALCTVIVSSKIQVSIKATILLGELLCQADKNIPEHGIMFHALPLLLEKAAGVESEEKVKASDAITALLQISRNKLGQHKEKNSNNTSLYLSHILANSREKNDGDKAISPTSDPAKMNKWLGKDNDDIIQHILKEIEIATEAKDYSLWHWDKLVPVLRWPSNSLLLLEDNVYRVFAKKLLNYFKPSSNLFSLVSSTDKSARMQAEALILFCEFLLRVPQDDQQKYLGSLLSDMSSSLMAVGTEVPHGCVFSPLHLNTSLSQYYFLAIGILTRSSRGYDMVLKANIYNQMMKIVELQESEIYVKLIVSTLDYSINGLNRKILNKILIESKENCRIYATQFMRVLIRAQAPDFTHWGVDLLVSQLYDENRVVALTAFDVLDEALDNEDYLEAVLKAPPSVQHLGDKGQLLLAKLVGSPNGFRPYHDCNFISTLLDKWANTFNIKYVKLMENGLSESVTQLQRGDDGSYGRRTGNKHVVHDLYLLPHLYGSLTKHKEGFSVLIQHESVVNLIQTIRDGSTSNIQEIYKLKAAIWALGHLGSSPSGVNFLLAENVIEQLLDLGSFCPVYSVRGTVFHALCLIAVTWEGANILQKYGWLSVRRHHQEEWQINQMDFQLSKEENLHKMKSTADTADNEQDNTHRSGGFYFLDESEDEGESISLLMDDTMDADVIARKSQTLPHDSRPSSFISHQRSFSDCAPVIEELNGSSIQSQESSNKSKRGSRLKNKILASFRRSSKRRDSAGSKASNSSSEKKFSFFNSKQRKRGISCRSGGTTDGADSLGDSTDFPTILLTSNSDDEFSKSRNSENESGCYLYNRRDSKEPCGTPSSTSYSQSGALNSHCNTPSSVGSYSLHRLKPGVIQRRCISESSHDELQSKNSLMDFLSSSYEHSSLNYRNMARSPSACSEISSVRSFSTLGVRGGSSNWLYGKGIVSSPPEDSHPSGHCYMGLVLPLDVDKLLYDSTYQNITPASEEIVFPNLSEKDFKSHFDIKREEMKTIGDKKTLMSLEEDSVFEFHSSASCITCSSRGTYSSDVIRDSNKSITEEVDENECVLYSPSLTRTKVNDGFSEVSSSVNSYDENVVTSTKQSDPLQNRYLVRKEILKFVSNLSNSFITKSSESGLLALKQRLSWAFEDCCLYSEIYAILSSYSYRLNARRFIQELFLDLPFKEVFEVSKHILNTNETLYGDLIKLELTTQVNSEEYKTDYVGVPEYNINDFEGFDLQE